MTAVESRIPSDANQALAVCENGGATYFSGSLGGRPRPYNWRSKSGREQHDCHPIAVGVFSSPKVLFSEPDASASLFNLGEKSIVSDKHRL